MVVNTSGALTTHIVPGDTRTKGCIDRPRGNRRDDPYEATNRAVTWAADSDRDARPDCDEPILPWLHPAYCSPGCHYQDRFRRTGSAGAATSRMATAWLLRGSTWLPRYDHGGAA